MDALFWGIALLLGLPEVRRAQLAPCLVGYPPLTA
jgi:hypothetical protein